MQQQPDANQGKANTMADKAQVYLAGLRLDITNTGARAAPTQIRLIPAGQFKSADGRPGKTTDDGFWRLDSHQAQKIIDALATQATDLLIDYEHQSLHSLTNGKPVPAAGWLKQLEWRADGLWATDVSWTAAAKTAIEAAEYRYLSPVLVYDKQGKVLGLRSIALTNTPALDTLGPLVSRSALSSIIGGLESTMATAQPPQGDDVQALQQQVAALTKERDDLSAQLAAQKPSDSHPDPQIAALTKAHGEAQAQVVALTKERDDLKAAQAAALAEADKKAHADLLSAALTKGTVTPAQKPWAEKQSLQALTEYITASDPVFAAGRQSQPGTGATALSDTEMAMCSRMGVSPEDFLKNKE